jgi:hypothetical protein
MCACHWRQTSSRRILIICPTQPLHTTTRILLIKNTCSLTAPIAKNHPWDHIIIPKSPRLNYKEGNAGRSHTVADNGTRSGDLLGRRRRTREEHPPSGKGERPLSATLPFSLSFSVVARKELRSVSDRATQSVSLRARVCTGTSESLLTSNTSSSCRSTGTSELFLTSNRSCSCRRTGTFQSPCTTQHIVSQQLVNTFLSAHSIFL